MSETSNENAATSLAGTITLDGIFRLSAARHPQRTALIDPPDRETFTDGAPRSLSYAQADRAVAALAGRLREFALPAGSVVGVQLPNTVESIIAVLAIMRAGLTAALLPLLWRRAEASRALADAGAKALIVCGRVGNTNHAELALHVAADTFTIRYVCGFGEDLPDGVVALDDIWSETAAPDDASAGSHDMAAVITFEVGPDGVTPIARTHGELMAAGLAVVLEAGLPRQARLVSTMLSASCAALSACFVPWLLTGGALALHEPFDAEILAAQLAFSPCDALVVPGPLAARLAGAGSAQAQSSPAALIAVWRAPERCTASAPWTAATPLTDVLAFGEIAALPLRRRADGRPGALRPGPVVVADGTVVATLARSGRGTLELGGPMVPQRVPVDTGYPCRIEASTGELVLTGGVPGIVNIGGYRFAMHELQTLVGNLDADGVLAALPDLLAGARLAGFARDATAMREALAALGVNPLVGEAFRDRRSDQAPAA